MPNSIWGTRHLIIVFVPAAVLVANAVANAHNRRFRVGATTLIVLFSSYALVVHIRQPATIYTWCSWEQLATEWQLKPFVEPGSTKLYVLEDLVAYHFWFAVRNNPNYKVVKVNGFPGVIEDRAYFLPRGFDRVAEGSVNDSFSDESFWIAFRDPDPSAANPGVSMVPYTRR